MKECEPINYIYTDDRSVLTVAYGARHRQETSRFSYPGKVGCTRSDPDSTGTSKKLAKPRDWWVQESWTLDAMFSVIKSKDDIVYMYLWILLTAMIVILDFKPRFLVRRSKEYRGSSSGYNYKAHRELWR